MPIWKIWKRGGKRGWKQRTLTAVEVGKSKDIGSATLGAAIQAGAGNVDLAVFDLHGWGSQGGDGEGDD